jgi:arginyl-tRNA synthetase
MELAGRFHRYYNKHKVLGDNPELTAARLQICRALMVVLRNGLQLAGISAPKKM